MLKLISIVKNNKHKVIFGLLCFGLLCFVTHKQHVSQINKLLLNYLDEFEIDSTLILVDTSITKKLDIERIKVILKSKQKNQKVDVCFYKGNRFLTSLLDDLAPFIDDKNIIYKYDNHLSVNVFYGGQKFGVISRYILAFEPLENELVQPDKYESKTFYVLLPFGIHIDI